MKFYSQFGQDQFLYENYFKNKDTGYFVDIGAHDGITCSNSYFFEQIGWDGICFEPMPKIFLELEKNRKCLCKNIAVSDKIGKDQFFCIDGHSEMLSGIVSAYEQEHIARIHRELESHSQSYDYIYVDCSTFENEIKETHIDMLSIDTEGSEETIIKSINFEKYNIHFLVFEMNYYNEKLINFVNSKNFEFITSLGPDLVFKNKNYE
jgi:FkbM family methyltransferase